MRSKEGILMFEKICYTLMVIALIIIAVVYIVCY